MIRASGTASEGSGPLANSTRPSWRPERRGELAGRPSFSRAEGRPRHGARGRPPGADSDGPSPPPPKMRHSQQPRQAEPSQPGGRPRRAVAGLQIGPGGRAALAGGAVTLRRARLELDARRRPARPPSRQGQLRCLASGGRRCRSAHPPERPRPAPPLPFVPALPSSPARPPARMPRPGQPMAPGGTSSAAGRALSDAAQKAQAGRGEPRRGLAPSPHRQTPSSARRRLTAAVERGAPGCGEAGAKRGRAPAPRSRRASARPAEKQKVVADVGVGERRPRAGDTIKGATQPARQERSQARRRRQAEGGKEESPSGARPPAYPALCAAGGASPAALRTPTGRPGGPESPPPGGAGRAPGSLAARARWNAAQRQAPGTATCAAPERERQRPGSHAMPRQHKGPRG
ncbi:uncharacterized protein LOC129342917 [Eublepharis macularius]|uniref:Uncharacterized protein LOC129342917 n=1 Tax=Eublepharis macularius TaxID=481883 RepID=A0AA97LK89_EUBMA|nr:uncharacterized protein LOC129342917 [Eublepharis macularius]